MQCFSVDKKIEDVQGERISIYSSVPNYSYKAFHDNRPTCPKSLIVNTFSFLRSGIYFFLTFPNVNNRGSSQGYVENMRIKMTQL